MYLSVVTCGKYHNKTDVVSSVMFHLCLVTRTLLRRLLQAAATTVTYSNVMSKIKDRYGVIVIDNNMVHKYI